MNNPILDINSLSVVFNTNGNRISALRDLSLSVSQGEIVAIDKPMPGAIKVKLEDGTVVTMGERQLKFAGTENEPWEKFKTPAKPKPTLDEILTKHGPEEIYMEPARPGSPKWTGD